MSRSPFYAICWVWLPVSRRYPFARCRAAIPFCTRTRSVSECLRHSRGRNPLPAIREGRHFAVKRETGIFPAKSAYSHLCSRGKRNYLSAISTPRFSFALTSGWPAFNFCILSKRDIYETFCLGTIWWRQAGRRRKYDPPLVSA